MMGFRNTLLFYTFKDQQAILTLSIDNTDETFPVKGKIYLFDDATTEEGLKKWINNQHSDGLFPEIPTPIFTKELPEGTCKVTSHKQTGTSENPSPISPATFNNYEVELSVKEHAIDGKVKISAFTDKAQVHVKSEAGEVEAEPVTQAGDAINVDLLARAWTHSREEDTDFEGKVFRPTDSRKFPPSRFRKRYVFNKDGSGEFLYLHPTDRHSMVACQWKITEDDPRRIIITGMIGGKEYKENIEVLELAKDILRVK
jgi:hypothetical protein